MTPQGFLLNLICCTPVLTDEVCLFPGCSLSAALAKMPIGANSDVIDWTYSGNKLLPTQRSQSILLPFVETFSPLVAAGLDPFSGSRSALLVASSLGRSCLGMELDPEHHAIDSRRPQN